MIRPLDNSYAAIYYDGQVAARRTAVVQLSAAELNIEVEGGAAGVWPYCEMRITADGTYGEPVRIEHGASEAVVIESRNFVEALRQHGVTRQTLPLDLRSWPAVLLCCIAIAVIASVFYSWGIGLVSQQVVRLMPPGMEKRLGRATVRILAPEPSRCKDSQRRLQPIVDRLKAAAGRNDFEVIYVNQGIVNAFAAPGGYVVIYRGLLDEARTPEEFAGVLAHEMEHVLLKHSVQALAREFSARALLSLMAIDSSGTPTAAQASVRLANLKYQRSDESDADLAGVALLQRAQISPDGLLTFLRRMQTLSPPAGSMWNYLSTHPSTDERIDALAEETQKTKRAATPLMSADDWLIARDVCSEE